jgi:hypothetical protein
MIVERKKYRTNEEKAKPNAESLGQTFSETVDNGFNDTRKQVVEHELKRMQENAESEMFEPFSLKEVRSAIKELTAKRTNGLLKGLQDSSRSTKEKK